MNILEARCRLLEGGVKKRTAEGNPIVVRSLARMYPGLNIYGKSTQSGTPSPDNPVPIVSAGDSGEINVRIAGAQLFDFENADIVNMYIANSGIGEYPQNWSVVVPISPNTIYTISEKNKNTIRAALLSEYPYDGIQALYKVVISQYDSIVIPSGYEANYLMIQLYGNFMDKPDFSGIMINYGSIALPYEHYKLPQTLPFQTPNGLPGIPVSSGGNYTDESGQQWVCDEVDFKRGKYVKRVIKYTGPYQVMCWPSSDSWFLFVVRLENIPKPKCKGFCNVSDRYSQTWENLGYSHWFLQTKSQQIVIHLGDKYNTEEAVQQFIAENEIVVYYVAETPIETDLTPEQITAYQSLHTNYPTTTVMNDSDAGMKLTYKTRKSLEVTT